MRFVAFRTDKPLVVDERNIGAWSREEGYNRAC